MASLSETKKTIPDLDAMMSSDKVCLRFLRPPEMCLQVSRYPETPATRVHLRTVLLSVVFTAAKPLTFGTSTETKRDQ